MLVQEKHAAESLYEKKLFSFRPKTSKYVHSLSFTLLHIQAKYTLQCVHYHCFQQAQITTDLLDCAASVPLHLSAVCDTRLFKI